MVVMGALVFLSMFVLGQEGEPVETWIRVNRPFVRSSVGGLEIETASMQDGKKV